VRKNGTTVKYPVKLSQILRFLVSHIGRFGDIKDAAMPFGNRRDIPEKCIKWGGKEKIRERRRLRIKNSTFHSMFLIPRAERARWFIASVNLSVNSSCGRRLSHRVFKPDSQGGNLERWWQKLDKNDNKYKLSKLFASDAFLVWFREMRPQGARGRIAIPRAGARRLNSLDTSREAAELRRHFFYFFSLFLRRHV